MGAHQGTIYDDESQADVDDNQLKKDKRGKIKKKRHGGTASEKFTTSVGRQTKKGAHRGIRKGIISQDQENGQDFYEPLSYKKLSKKIEIHHPCDPDTKKKLEFSDRISVKDFESKMMDVCFCYALTQSFKKLRKYILKRFRGEKKIKFVKPKSMEELPSSGSSSSGSA